MRCGLILYGLFTLAALLVGILGSFYSPVWPVLMAVTLLTSCMAQLVRLLGEVGPDLPLVGFLFHGASGRYHQVQPEGLERLDEAEAFELQRQILALSSAAASSPSRAAAFSRILQALSTTRDFSPEDFASLQELDTLWGQEAPGRGRASMTPEQISALPTWSYSATPRGQQAGSSSGSSSSATAAAAAAAPAVRSCSICLEAFAQGEALKTLPCVHNFHAACIDPWLAINGVCPECRCSCLEDGGEEGGGAGQRAANPWAPRGSALV